MKKTNNNDSLALASILISVASLVLTFGAFASYFAVLIVQSPR